MSKIKLYGPAQSRASRALWIANELGLDFEHVTMEMKDSKSPEFLKINPNGKFPAMVDGDLSLFESMAINLYLARKYGQGKLWPATIEDEGRAYQWSFWGMTEVEKHLLTVVIDMYMTPPDKKNPKAVEDAKAAVVKPFKVLNDALEGKQFLLGDSFTIADLNLASVMGWAKLAKIDMAGVANVANWLDRCLSRPSYKKR